MTPPALSLLVLALATPGPQDPVGASWLDPETFPSSLQAELLDNGDFELEFEPLADDPGGPAPARIPWWTPVLVEGGDWERAERGWVEVGTLLAGAGRALPRVEDGALLLGGGADLVLTQPVAAHRPRVADLWMTGRVRGAGRLVLRDGSGRTWHEDVGHGSATWTPFTWKLSDLAAGGASPRPRLTLGLAAAGDGPAAFDDLAVHVPLPLSNPLPEDPLQVERLVLELEALVTTLVDQLHEGGRDRFGPRESAFWVGLHDVDTGAFRGGGGRGGAAAPLTRVGLSPLNRIYLDLAALGLDGEVQAERFAALTEEFLTSCFHPDTGLPRRYDPVTDEPVDHQALEVAAYLEHLIDLATGGVAPGHGAPPRTDLLPADLHTRAFEQAVTMGRRLLEVGVQPDGSVAALLTPATGAASTNVVHLRRLDVPAQLVRLAALLRDRDTEPELQAALVAAAREAVLEVEYANLWPGTWRTIDPGFDDTYGHLGERSIAMAAAWPEEPAFARLARTGRDHFGPLWRQALMHGGNVAADQVRCWRILAELDALDARQGREPWTTDGLTTGDLLLLAARNHFKGEQTTTGSWLDVTVVGHAPATNLPVGDIIGLPQNLFEGLAVVREHQALFGRDQDTLLVEAMFATVLVATVETYGAPHGFSGGDRTSSGSIRILGGLVSMLEAIDEH